MFPPGHAAFAYFIARFVIHKEITALGFLFLAAGAVQPTVVNVLLLELEPTYRINNLWSHSIVTLLAAWGVVALVYALRVPFRSLLLLFAIGFTTHVATDPFFEIFHLYLSARTNDVGGQWLFPFVDLVIRQPNLEPGYLVWPWQLAAELVFLAVAIRHWMKERGYSWPDALKLRKKRLTA
jgi:hypothetical protein